MSKLELITRDQAPDLSVIYTEGHAALWPLALGAVVKIGIRGSQMDEWPWASVRRVLENRVWVAVEDTVNADDHGVESDQEIEIRPEHIHIVIDPAAQALKLKHRKQAMQKLLRSARCLLEQVDRHLKLGTVPQHEQLSAWAIRLDLLAEFHEYLKKFPNSDFYSRNPAAVPPFRTDKP